MFTSGNAIIQFPASMGRQSTLGKPVAGYGVGVDGNHQAFGGGTKEDMVVYEGQVWTCALIY